MKKDNLFNTSEKPVPPFEFNEKVARVFNDMIHRSVPMYPEVIQRQAQLAKHYYRKGTRVYDMGCSNGNFCVELCEKMGPESCDMVAVDNSIPMLDLFKNRLEKRGWQDRVKMVCGNIQDVPLDPASVVVINYTLQFLPVEDRDRLITRIFNSLVPGGILLFSEKIIHQDTHLSDLQVDFYYRFKRENGYSELEISRKREALENVLIPETIESHHQRLSAAGFTRNDIWLKWFNFTSWICRKA